VKPKTLEDIAREKALVEKALKGELVEAPKKDIPLKGPGARTFNVFVDDEYYEVTVDDAGETPVVQSITKPVTASGPKAEAKPAPAASKKPAPKNEPEMLPAISEGVTAVSAPMPGVIIKVLVNVGDTVKAGDAVIILEAMKVENTLSASTGGKVVAVNCATGDSVKKGAVLVQIA